MNQDNNVIIDTTMTGVYSGNTVMVDTTMSGVSSAVIHSPKQQQQQQQHIPPPQMKQQQQQQRPSSPINSSSTNAVYQPQVPLGFVPAVQSNQQSSISSLSQSNMPPPSFIPQQRSTYCDSSSSVQPLQPMPSYNMSQQIPPRQINEEDMRLQQAMEYNKREEEEKQRRTVAAATTTTTTTVATTSASSAAGADPGNEDLARKALYSSLVETANPHKLKRDPVTTLPPPTPVNVVGNSTQSPTHSPVVPFSMQQPQQQQSQQPQSQQRSPSPFQNMSLPMQTSQPYTFPSNQMNAPPTPLVMPNMNQGAMQQQQQGLQLPQFQPQQQQQMTPMINNNDDMSYLKFAPSTTGMTPYMNGEGGMQQQQQTSSLPFTSPLQMPAITANMTNPALASTLMSTSTALPTAATEEPLPSMLPKPEEKKPLTPEEEAGRKAWLMEEFKIFAKMGIIPPVVPEFGMPLDMLEKLHEFCEDLFEDKVGVDMMGAGYVQLIKLIEFTNERFHPVSRFTGGSDLKLEGAGRRVEEKIDKFKLPFTKIYRKYLKNKIGGEASPFMQIGIQTLKILGKVHNDNLNKEMHEEAELQYRQKRAVNEEEYADDDNDERGGYRQPRRNVSNQPAVLPRKSTQQQRRSLDEQQLTSYRGETATTIGSNTKVSSGSTMQPPPQQQQQQHRQPASTRIPPTTTTTTTTTTTAAAMKSPSPPPPPPPSLSGLSFNPGMLLGFGDDGFDETNAMAPPSSSPTIKKSASTTQKSSQPTATSSSSSSSKPTSSTTAVSGSHPLPRPTTLASPTMTSSQYKPQGAAVSTRPATMPTSSSKSAMLCDSDICVLLPKSPTTTN